MRQQVIKGIRWTIVSSIGGNILQLLQLVIVTTYITSADYGLMSVTLAITYFAQFFGDMGISNALIYKPHVSKLAFSTLFWVFLFFCWLVFVALFLLSPVLAQFFKQPELTPVIRITAFSFLFMPLQIQYLAILKKELQFDKIAICDILSRFVCFVTAIILAIRGLGVFSLVYSTLAGLAVSTLLYSYWGSRLYAIGLNFSLREIKEYLRFGIYQTGNDILNYFNFQVDTLLVGRLLGIDIVGFYAFAKNLAFKPSQFINPAVTQIAFPVLAKVNQNRQQLQHLYLRMMRHLSTLNFYAYPFIIVFAETIIRVFFNDKWLPAAPVLQLLAVYCMIRSVFNPVGALLSSQGMVKRLFYWNLLLILIVPVILFFSAQAGMASVAIALTGFFIVLFVPMWRYLVFPATGLRLQPFWGAISPPLLHAAILLVILYLCSRLGTGTPLLDLVAGVLAWSAGVFVLVRFFNKDFYRDAREMIHKPFGRFKTTSDS